MSTRNYGNDKVSASWLGLEDIREGTTGDGDWFADGGRANPPWTVQSDRAGNVTQSHDNRKNGTFTLNVLRSSALSGSLHTIFRNDEIFRNQVGNFTVTDLNKDQKYIYKNVRISNRPAPSFGPTVQVEAWEFIYEALEVPETIALNIIGN